MQICGGKDAHFNDGTVIKGAFEGFPGSRLEQLNLRYEVLLHYTMQFLTNCAVQGLNRMCVCVCVCFLLVATHLESYT